MATAALSGYSTTLQVSQGGSPLTYRAIAEVFSISGIGISRETIEASHLTSPQGWKEFIYGVKMGTEFSCELNYIPQDDTQQDLITDATDATADAYRTWRFVMPDFGAVTKTYTSSGTTFTATSHGFLTGQSVTFTTTGTLPSGVTAGRVYWIRYATANAFSVHNSPEDSYTPANLVNGGTGGSGTHTVNGTSLWAFTAACKGLTVNDTSVDGRLTATATFSVSGPVTQPA